MKSEWDAGSRSRRISLCMYYKENQAQSFLCGRHTEIEVSINPFKIVRCTSEDRGVEVYDRLSGVVSNLGNASVGVQY